MKYAYKIENKYGKGILTTQKSKFTEQDIIAEFQKAYPKDEYDKCTYIGEIKRGYTLCGCGKIFKGISGQLCPECAETFGHSFESEL